MSNLLRRYAEWLHTGWPAGTVEKLPEVGEDGKTSVPGVYVVGDLSGVPLLKFAIDTGVKTVHAIERDPSFRSLRAKGEETIPDLAILGGGLSGYAAAIEAKRLGLSYVLIEANRPLATLHDFPKRKPIYTYPNEMTPAGELQVAADVKETLVEELEKQIADCGIETLEGHVESLRRKGDFVEVQLSDREPMTARRVIVAIGRSGNHHKLGVPGEDLDKVYNRLHDPTDFCGQEILVVGGGDTALETAIALAQAGGRVTLSYRAKEFSRPKQENTDKVLRLAGSEGEGALRLELETTVKEIRKDSVILATKKGDKSLPNDVVFTAIGREAPLGFFRKSGIRIQGEWTLASRLGMIAFLVFCTWMYLWKTSGNPVGDYWVRAKLFPYNLEEGLATLAKAPDTLLGTLALSATQPAFYYGLLYSVVVTAFGIRRIRKRKTPYITKQTVTLIAIQVLPLFILPFVLLPWLGHNDLIPAWFSNTFFPEADYDPHGREYWRSLGFILAWPLFIHNVFTSEPMWGWLAVSLVQTFVLIPGMIYFWGKGAYCGWICSCGALAETLGDDHRTKMPHGPKWNRLNMAGQGILLFAFALLGLRILAWMGVPGIAGVFGFLSGKIYKFGVDVTLSAIVGVGFYFWYSGRVWCRFLCPLAALMHIYHRFSRFRILSEKKKCISCNVCTSVCHQGIDVMNFANKGTPMADPQCVRCSACVQSCPTGVLSFGQVDGDGRVLSVDRTPASTLSRV